MKRSIRRVAVIGSGVMGSAISCHFANIGVFVILLDISPKKLTEKEKNKGYSLEDYIVKKRIVNENLDKALSSKPSPIYDPSFVSRIETGSLEDDLFKISQVDWVIEVVIEKLDVKKEIFEKIEKYRKPGTLVTSNTSGVPIKYMSEGRSEDFVKHFAITHFFNPPRYMKLLEIIPSSKCKPEVLSFLMNYGEKFLGKTTVLAKDTPAFIGNRIGVFSIMSLFPIIEELKFSVEQVDKLTGPIIGRPKSATFRTIDLVGIDTLIYTAKGITEKTRDGNMSCYNQISPILEKMLDKKFLGEKTKKGFYKKQISKSGKKSILTYDIYSNKYRDNIAAKFSFFNQASAIENLNKRYTFLINIQDKAGVFYRKSFALLFAYVSKCIPEISDDLYRIDDAIKTGFGWKHGPFEIWDAIGLDKGIELIEAEKIELAQWVSDMLKSGKNSFYSIKDGERYYYSTLTKARKKISGQENFIILNTIREYQTIWSNNEAAIQHLGDGVLNVEFQTKMNTLGSGVLEAINKGIDLAETQYEALVIANQGENFSVGANLYMAFMMALEQEYDELAFSIAYFQNTVMRLRYSSVPTVLAPYGMTLGGGCEMALHADKVVASAETYIGLVECGVGLIPSGAGTKEMISRTSKEYLKSDVKLNRIRETFMNIVMSKVSTSAHQAYNFNYLEKGKDIVVLQYYRQIATAKKYALQMLDDGYTQPTPQKIEVLGQQALGMFLVGSDSFQKGNYASKHDQLVANKLGYVMAGGDLSEPTLVSEQYLLDLEREAFLSLLTEKKTLERIEHTLKTGKPLRN